MLRGALFGLLCASTLARHRSGSRTAGQWRRDKRVNGQTRLLIGALALAGGKAGAAGQKGAPPLGPRGWTAAGLGRQPCYASRGGQGGCKPCLPPPRHGCCWARGAPQAGASSFSSASTPGGASARRRMAAPAEGGVGNSVSGICGQQDQATKGRGGGEAWWGAWATPHGALSMGSKAPARGQPPRPAPPGRTCSSLTLPSARHLLK